MAYKGNHRCLFTYINRLKPRISALLRVWASLRKSTFYAKNFLAMINLIAAANGKRDNPIKPEHPIKKSGSCYFSESWF